jgi:hypothetical protein
MYNHINRNKTTEGSQMNNGTTVYFIAENGTATNGEEVTSEQAEGWHTTKEGAQKIADESNERNGWQHREDKDVVYSAIINNDQMYGDRG